MDDDFKNEKKQWEDNTLKKVLVKHKERKKEFTKL